MLVITFNFKQKDNKEIVPHEIETLGLRHSFDIQCINDPFIISGQLLQHKKYVDKI